MLSNSLKIPQLFQIDFFVTFKTTDLMQCNGDIADSVECVEPKMLYFRAFHALDNIIQFLVTNVCSHFDSCATRNL